jgi:2-alkyl-3-oxoalkanoate reductase
MRSLVLGGSGFLGGALVPQLVTRGHAVTVVTRDVGKVPRLEAMGARAVLGDLLEPASLRPVPEVDAVVLLAQPAFFGKRIGRARFARLTDEVTRLNLSALVLARERSIPIVVTGGTAYRTRGDEVADESWPLTRTGVARIGAGVDPLLEQVRREGTPKFVRLLPGQIYGPGGMTLQMIEWARNGRNGIIGDGKNRIPRVHVDDCAAAYALALESLPRLPTAEQFIVADDVACTTEAFSTELAAQLGLPPPRHVPRPVQLALRVVLGKYLFETMQMDCQVSNQKLKRELGWAPRYASYREGLAATIAALDRGPHQPAGRQAA